jgi:hypothetical protein
MTTIVTRAGKGSPLTNSEVDTNFTNLNTAKLEFGTSFSGQTANGVLYLDGSKNVANGSALTFDGVTLKSSQGSSGTTAPTNANALVLENGAAVGMTFLTPDANASRIYFGTASNNRNAFIYSDYNAGAQTLIFGLGSGATAATEQMRLTSTGLGIKTSSPAYPLDVNGYGRLSNGLVGGGGLTMYGDTSSAAGMFLTTSGNLGIGTSSPSQKLQVSGTGTPTIRIEETTSGGSKRLDLWVDSATAISYVGANQSAQQLGFQTASTTRLLIDNSGNVGIGTSSPSRILTIEKSGAAFPSASNPTVRLNETSSGRFAVMELDSSQNLNIWNGDAGSGSIRFYRGSGSGTLSMQLDGSGNLGLGVTPSAWKSGAKVLELGNSGDSLGINYGAGLNMTRNSYVNASSVWTYGSTDYASRYAQSSGQHVWYNAPSGTAGTAITFTQAMTLDASGNLGIGTTSPVSRLDASATISRILNLNTTSATGYGIAFQNSGTDVGYIGSAKWNFTGGALNDMSITTYGAYNLCFGTNITERMRIDSSGNLGIGTSSPSVKLDVVVSSGTATVKVGNGTVSGGALLNLQGASSSKTWFVGSNYNIAGALEFTQSTANGGSTIGSTPSMLLDSSGNLGLGVTPSAWGANYSAMQFRTKAGIGNYSGTDSIELLSNAYASANNAFNYIETYASARYVVGAGAHSWYTAASGTAGSAITFTQAMTLFASGGLSVGNTSDPGAGNISAQNDFRLGSASYSRVAVQDGGGGWAGGYNTTYSSGTVRYDSTGSMSGFWYTNGGTIQWYTGGSNPAGTVAIERMRIDSSGNVGIGTSSPTAKLDVLGSGTVYSYLRNSTTTALTAVDVSAAYFGSGTNSPVIFQINNGEKMRLDTSGNLGLGVTPSGNYQLQAGSGSGAAGRGFNLMTVAGGYSGGDYPSIGYNFRTTTTGGSYLYNATDVASSIGFSSVITFNTASSGTAGNAITFNERMRIDSSGNLLVNANSIGSYGRGILLGSGGSAQAFTMNVSGGGATINGIDTVNSSTAGFTMGHITTTNKLQMRVGSTNGVELASGGTSWSALSDERLKDIIEPITNAADKISTLRAVIGKYKSDSEGTRRSFLIAQDVQAVLPEAVSTTRTTMGNEKEFLTVAYTDTIPLLVAAIKEQQAIITQLTSRIAALESKGA